MKKKSCKSERVNKRFTWREFETQDRKIEKFSKGF